MKPAAIAGQTLTISTSMSTFPRRNSRVTLPNPEGFDGNILKTREIKPSKLGIRHRV